MIENECRQIDINKTSLITTKSEFFTIVTCPFCGKEIFKEGTPRLGEPSIDRKIFYAIRNHDCIEFHI